MKVPTCLLVGLAPAAVIWAAVVPAVTYRIETIAGSDRMGDGGQAWAAQFGSIQGLAADRNGNLYIADTDYHRVRKVSLSGVVSTLAGTGAAGYSGDGGPAASAQLNLPYGLAADAAGYLYIGCSPLPFE